MMFLLVSQEVRRMPMDDVVILDMDENVITHNVSHTCIYIVHVHVYMYNAQCV